LNFWVIKTNYMIDRLLRSRNFLLTICLSFLLISLTYLIVPVDRPLLAQSDLSLKSDITSLQSRISRLEQEVNYLRSRSSRSSRSSSSQSLDLNAAQPKQPTSRTTIVNPPVVDGQVIGRTDPLYNRLATLLIELREDVNQIDRRLTAVEKIEKTTP
jgi:hypothetical protein